MLRFPGDGMQVAMYALCIESIIAAFVYRFGRAKSCMDATLTFHD